MRRICCVLAALTIAACTSKPEKIAAPKAPPAALRTLQCKGTHYYNPVEVAKVVVDVTVETKTKLDSMSATVSDLDDKKVEEAKGHDVVGEPFDAKNPNRKDRNIFAFPNNTKKDAKSSLILSPELEGTGYFMRELPSDPLAVKLTCKFVKGP